MKALTYQGIRKVRVERVDDPETLKPTNAIVKVHRTAAEAYHRFDRKAVGCVKIILDTGIEHI